MTRRYKITVEYDGTFFCGWQRQRTDALFFAQPEAERQVTEALKPSVQGTLEWALAQMTGQSVLVEGAGRTDTGVHALGQVAHFDLEAPEGGAYLEAFKLIAGLNFYAQKYGVVVLEAEVVPADDVAFHARFSARSREYLYRIVLRRAPLILERHRAWHVALAAEETLDIEAMQAAASAFLGTHDFSAFRASACQSKSPIKTLDRCLIRPTASGLEIEVQARSFLHNQVRIMVGTLMAIGRGRLQASAVAELLKSGDRTKGGPTAPPYGLYLWRVHY